MRRRIVVLATAVGTALAGLVISGPARAVAPPPRLSIGTTDVTVHTSNGTKWGFGLATSQADQGDDLTLHITRSSARGSESHYWDVPVPAAAITFNRNTGRGTLKTGQSAAALTTVNMAFKATGHHSLLCASGSATDYAGNLTGRATLITHLNGGGTVGGQHLSFKAGTTHLVVDNNCLRELRVDHRCFKSTFYEADGPHHRSVFGFTGGSTRYIELSHQVTLAHPAGATRTDYASSRSSRAPVLNKTAKTLTVFGSTDGFVTGSGTVTTSTLSDDTHPCTINGTQHTEHRYTPDTAHFANAAGHPIVGHASLTGRLTVADNDNGYFEYETWT